MACSNTSRSSRTTPPAPSCGGLAGAPWADVDWDGEPDRAFTAAATPEQLYALWDGAVERSRARLDASLANGGLDQFVDISSSDGRHASLRRLVCDLIEEYGRHTGHADLLREAVDGLVGEDPPAGWRRKSRDRTSPLRPRPTLVLPSQ